jgi:hypothetical protein
MGRVSVHKKNEFKDQNNTERSRNESQYVCMLSTVLSEVDTFGKRMNLRKETKNRRGAAKQIHLRIEQLPN